MKAPVLICIVAWTILFLGPVAIGQAASPNGTRPVARRALFAVTEQLLAIYRNQDAGNFHRLLAPELGAKYTPEMLTGILEQCWDLTGEIIRISPPVLGTRYFGYSAAYAAKSTLDMILEIDNNERVLFWMISADVTAQDQRCRVYNHH
jgi:hypothetical protein